MRTTEQQVEIPHAIECLIPSEARQLVAENEQKGIPAIAKNPKLTQAIEQALSQMPTHHRLIRGDSRLMTQIPDESVHLVVTSPPYWNLKQYAGHDQQLGDIDGYDGFLDELDKVWQHVFRVLVPGGRIAIVVGDVCVSRRRHGRHAVFPLHASIQERCRRIGFDNLAPIIWYKISNAQLEAEGKGSGFLGKPYEPNGVVKNDIEYILFQRKPGGYRKPSLTSRIMSVIPEQRHRQWFQQIWSDIKGASTRNHPAPFPVELAERLIRMFSFAGDTVLDPFMGSASTNVAASLWGRHSIGIEVEPTYYQSAVHRLQTAPGSLFREITVD